MRKRGGGGGRTQSEGAHSGGRGTAFARVRRSKSSMRLTFHWSRKICHVPRQKVVTGMASNHSLPAPAFASLLPPLLLLLPARLTATREKGEQREVALCPLNGVDPPSELLVQTRSEPCRNKLCSSVAIVMHSNKRPLRILILAGSSSHHGSQVYAVAANEREDDERGDRKVQRSAERSVNLIVKCVKTLWWALIRKNVPCITDIRKCITSRSQLDSQLNENTSVKEVRPYIPPPALTASTVTPALSLCCTGAGYTRG